MFAMKFQVAISQHGARQHARLEQDLKAVADSKDRSAPACEVADGVHHRRKPGNGAGPQVVTMREPARQNHHVGAVEARLLVPHELGIVTQHVLRRVIRVMVAIRSGEDDDGESHDSTSIL